MSGAYVYILRCADGSYYVGTTRKSIEERISEHNAGLYGGYTLTRASPGDPDNWARPCHMIGVGRGQARP